MNLKQALKRIADEFELNADELYEFALEDKIGGYHPDPRLSKWTIGSIWEVEGQILYALVRALKPKNVLEVGSFMGASTSHIAEALLTNGTGKLICVDINHQMVNGKRYKGIIEQVTSDLFDYKFPARKFDFVYEDANHDVEQVAHVWGQFKSKGKKNAMIVSHDAMHHVVGKAVREGIEEVTDEYLKLLVQPSDCGLAVWRK